MPADNPLPRLDELPGTFARLGLEIRVAAMFLTRFSLGSDGPGLPLGQAVRAFPVIGLAVGFAGGVVYLVADMIGLPPVIAAVLAGGAMTLATGGLHEDGLADTVDGLGGGRDRESALAIMRDSRIGSFGVLALVSAFVLRVAALATIELADTVALALMAAAAGSRACLPPVMYALTPARADGLSFDAGTPGRAHVLTAVAVGWVALMLGLGVPAGLLAILLAGLAGGAMIYLAQRKLGGHTGDVLGAVQQTTEIAILIAAVIVLT